MKRIVCFAVLAALGCGTPDLKSPQGAFADMAVCIDKADARCLYDKLDRDSRWAIQTIHKYLLEASSLVESSYPAGRKQDAYGSWTEEAFAKDDAGVFEAWCSKRRCLEQVAKGFGAIVKTAKRKSDTVVVETTRKQSFEMLFAEERWGITIFRGDLQTAKLRVMDRLAQVKKNAAEFDEQRLATGSVKSAGKDEQGE